MTLGSGAPLKVTVRRVEQATGIPAGYSVYNHEEGVSIPRTHPEGTISFIIEKAGVQTPATEVTYSGLPRYDLKSGIYLVGSFCDMEVNENAVYLGPLPDVEQSSYHGVYKPSTETDENVTIKFAQYTLEDNYTKFYGPRQAGTDFYAASQDVMLTKGQWEGDFGYNSSCWIFTPNAINTPDGLEYSIDFENHTVTFGNDTGNITGILEIEAPEDDAIYYDLKGFKIKNPSSGMYIRIKDGTATKVMIKGE